MINEQKLKNFFAENRSDIPDSGFSKQLQHYLPTRKSMVPKILMLICIIIGLSSTIVIIGFSTIQTHLLSLLYAVVHLQLPSVNSVLSYFGALAILSLIGFAILVEPEAN
jgi:hypothetical protein